MGEPGFWDDAVRAQTVVDELKSLKGPVTSTDEIAGELEEAGVLLELALEEKDEQTFREIDGMTAALARRLDKLDLETMLADPLDSRNVYLAIHAGAGGTDSCDWAQMLARMYERWLERSHYDIELLESSPGDEAGLRSLTLAVRGDKPYGYLKSEVGVHRLVRISPYDSSGRRHTSFASVDATPEVEEEKIESIPENEVRVDTFRASGAGGQHVNKVSSAVRITHLPTGIVVTCQNERSQHKNRRMALKMLVAKLERMKRLEREQELRAAYDDKGEIAWGNQIRSYVMQPYTLVKDHRTGYETSDVQRVLDGDIDGFIEAYLRKRLASQQ